MFDECLIYDKAQVRFKIATVFMAERRRPYAGASERKGVRGVRGVRGRIVSRISCSTIVKSVFKLLDPKPFEADSI